MVVDAHVHIKGGDKYRRQFPPELIVRQMDEAKVDKAVVFSICLPSRESNLLTRRAADAFPDRLIPFAHALPQEGQAAVEALEEAVSEWGFKGLKLHLGEVQGEPSLELLSPLVEKAVELGIPVLVDFVQNLDLARALAESFPECTLIVAHLGAHADEDLNVKFALLAREHENVYLDTSWVDHYWRMADVVRICGADKLVFGSDAPLYHPLVELTKIKVLRLPPEEEAKILGGNMARLLGL